MMRREFLKLTGIAITMPGALINKEISLDDFCSHLHQGCVWCWTALAIGDPVCFTGKHYRGMHVVASIKENENEMDL